MKRILSIIIVFLPWTIKRFILIKVWKYNIPKSAYIGLSYILPQKLIMDEGAYIGNLNIGIHLDLIKMGKNSRIVRSNWITGQSTKEVSKFFLHQRNRKAELIIGDECAITKKHHIDCTNSIIIGNYVTIAGYSSQLLTHSIDIYKNEQDSHPIVIGDYCFISTSVIILGGSILPSHCVLAAGAVLTKKYEEEWIIYGGVPAKPLKQIHSDAKYFSRKSGIVY